MNINNKSPDAKLDKEVYSDFTLKIARILPILFLSIVFIFLIKFISLNKFQDHYKQSACFDKKCFEIEIADTEASREQGLMFRTSMPDKSGMLFVFDEPSVHKFWMKNTLIPLDMIWISSGRQVQYISPDTPPCGEVGSTTNNCLGYGFTGDSSYVLEVNGGMAAKFGIKIGDTVVINYSGNVLSLTTMPMINTGKITKEFSISSIFANNELIEDKYTCKGLDINPYITLDNIPSDAQSLALIMDDPDAPRGLRVHRVMRNIPLIEKIEENSIPSQAVQGSNSRGENKYGGPCPPSGTHRYFFKVYALDTVLAISQDSDKDALRTAMSGHILAKAELIGLYSK